MRIIALLTLTAGLIGCATTVVKKNPGPHDTGIRFYRPKPYLLIQPGGEPAAIQAGKDVIVANRTTDRFVSIELKYMPDFGEEYSIKARTGIGTNKTKVSLQDGWNLTQIDQELDSKVNENISAFANLLGSAKGFIGTNAGPGAADTGAKFVVRASNVPIGFYEAVVSPGPDGRKQLYGWRYVGFAPYASCPLTVCGGDAARCDTAAVYALAFDNGVMTFKSLSEVQQGTSELASPRTPLDLNALVGVASEAIKKESPSIALATSVAIKPVNGGGLDVVLAVTKDAIALLEPMAGPNLRDKVLEAVRQSLLVYGFRPVTVKYSDK